MFKTIVYHLIGTPSKSIGIKGRKMFVSIERFIQQLEFLQSNGWVFISLEDAEQKLKGILSSSSKELLLTFDDGYLNTISTALPILAQFNIPAAMSICGSYLLPDTRKNIDIHYDKDFADIEMIIKWIDHGNAILAHSYNHFKLTHLSKEDCVFEIEEDYQAIRKYCGIIPKGIAYPFGSVNDQVINIVKNYYEYGFATNFGAETSWDNRFHLKRCCIDDNCSNSDLINLIES